MTRSQELQSLIVEQAYDQMLGVVKREEAEELFMSLYEAGLEEREMERQPSHGFQNVPELVSWFSDGEDARYEVN